VRALSVHSIRLLRKCPEKWRRWYIEGQREPTGGAQLVGSAVHAAELHQGLGRKILEGTLPSTADVLDAYTDEFKLGRERSEVDWQGERPGRLKDQGGAVLAAYHDTVAPRLRPVAVERGFWVDVPGVDWGFRGYIDLEEPYDVSDLKVRGPTVGHLSKGDAAGDLQATGELFAKRVEGAPARRFRFHSLLRGRAEPRVGDLAITDTTRTRAELDAFLDTLYRAAAEIHWRVSYDVWEGAPEGAWWCSQRYCGFWGSCRYGGALRNGRGLTGPRPVVKPTLEQVLAAARSTVRRSGRDKGTTTSGRVAAELGVPKRAAAAQLGVLASRREIERERGESGNGALAYRPDEGGG
jgi:hypothetical protein